MGIREHIIYLRFWEHCDEKQVDFLRGTSFKVTKIEETQGTEYHKYYLQEIEEDANA